MKKLIISQLILLLMLGFLSSCKKDSTSPVVLHPNAAGFYVYGTNTIAAASTDQTARMSLAVMDSSHTNGGAKTADSVYGKFMYIGASSTISFEIVTEKNGTYTPTVFGSSDAAYDSAEVTANGAVTAPFNCNMKDKVYHGTLKAGGAPISIVAEGLYYTVVDLNSGTFIIAAVKPEIIGDGPNFDWNKPKTFLAQTSVSKDGATYELKGQTIAGGEGYLYRFNNGFFFYSTTNFATHSFLGQSNYGSAWNNKHNTVSVDYDQNLANVVTGLYVIDLTYVAGTDSWTETKAVDFSNVKIGLEGNAYVYAPGDSGTFAGNNTDGYQLEVPTSVSGTTYTWKWSSVPLASGREFIFLQDATWGGLQIDASNPTITGTAITSGDIVDATKAPFSEKYHNFRVVNGINGISQKGNLFDITFTCDGITNVTTINIDVH